MRHPFVRPAYLGLLGALLLAGGSLPAADFTFNVPVVFQNVPSAGRFTVDCYVSTQNPPSAAGANVVGRGSAGATVVGGAFSGPLVVEVNASGINPPGSGRSYVCTLRFEGVASTGATYSASPGNAADVVSHATGQTLTEAHTSVSGPIPAPH